MAPLNLADKSCKLPGGASMNQTCFCSTSHGCSIGLQYGQFGGRVNLLLFTSNPFWTIFGLGQLWAGSALFLPFTTFGNTDHCRLRQTPYMSCSCPSCLAITTCSNTNDKMLTCFLMYPTHDEGAMMKRYFTPPVSGHNVLADQYITLFNVFQLANVKEIS